ncbi:MAG: hypothetical protein ABI442_07520 [Gemmatimonadaceae bacterium]
MPFTAPHPHEHIERDILSDVVGGIGGKGCSHVSAGNRYGAYKGGVVTNIGWAGSRGH